MAAAATDRDFASELGSAVESGDLDTARRLVLAYREEMCTQIRLAGNLQELQRIFAAALQTLEDRLTLARIMRAHIFARLHAATGQVVYQSPCRERHTWRMEA